MRSALRADHIFRGDSDFVLMRRGGDSNLTDSVQFSRRARFAPRDVLKLFESPPRVRSALAPLRTRGLVAERGRFELPIPFPIYHLSRVAR